MARVLEQARSFGVVLVFIPQTFAGLDDRAQEKRILGSVGLVVMHAHPEPDDLAALAGSRKVLELSHRYEEGVYSEVASAQLQDRPKVEPDWVREQKVGEAFVIHRGCPAKAAMNQAPQADPVALPESEELDRPLAKPEDEAPKELSYLDLAGEAEEVEEQAPKELSYLDDDMTEGGGRFDVPWVRSYAVGGFRAREADRGPAADGGRAPRPQAQAVGGRTAGFDRRPAGDSLRSAGAIPALRGGRRGADRDVLGALRLRRVRAAAGRRAAVGVVDAHRQHALADGVREVRVAGRRDAADAGGQRDPVVPRPPGSRR